MQYLVKMRGVAPVETTVVVRATSKEEAERKVLEAATSGCTMEGEWLFVEWELDDRPEVRDMSVQETCRVHD